MVHAARRRQQPVPHRADAHRPVPRRRADPAADHAARVPPVPGDHRSGDGRVRCRRRDDRRGRGARRPPAGTGAGEHVVEPDASSASYPLAAAAVCGGRVTVPGLGAASLQGDAAFADLLAAMGCRVERDADRTTVERSGALVGIDVDLADHSDLVPTLAVVAAVRVHARRRSVASASSAARRATASATCAPNCAAPAWTPGEQDDGLRIEPGGIHPARARDAPRPPPGDGLRRARRWRTRASRSTIPGSCPRAGRASGRCSTRWPGEHPRGGGVRRRPHDHPPRLRQPVPRAPGRPPGDRRRAGPAPLGDDRRGCPARSRRVEGGGRRWGAERPVRGRRRCGGAGVRCRRRRW